MFRKLNLFALWLMLATFFAVSAQAQTDLTGLWTGQTSGNQVRLEMRGNGFVQLPAGALRPGQKAGDFYFRSAGSGLYLYTKPDGNNVRVQVLGTDRIRVTNPDGWTDVFTRPPTLSQRSVAPVSGQSGDLSGLWTGQSSRNQVTIEMRSGGFAIVVAGQRRAGQYGDGQFFRASGSGLFIYTKPDGGKVRVQVLGRDSIRVTNPDGWTDVFRRTSTTVAAPAPRSEAPLDRLPTARPAKMAAWSPKAMTTEPGRSLSLRYAPERADALNACRAAFQQWESLFSGNDESTAAFLAMTIEQYWLSDSDMMRNIAAVQAEIAKTDADLAAANRTAVRLGGLRVGRCVLQRRLAQLGGSPLAPGAVDGSLSPLSIGGQAPPWKQQGKDARIIASNGKSAMDCVRLVEVSKTDARLSGTGGRVLVNNCAGPVEIGWCYSPGDCDTETGSSWTVRAGRSWPVSAEKSIRWAACHGANTTAFVKGSHGLRYYCSAPLGTAKR